MRARGSEISEEQCGSDTQRTQKNPAGQVVDAPRCQSNSQPIADGGVQPMTRELYDFPAQAARRILVDLNDG